MTSGLLLIGEDEAGSRLDRALIRQLGPEQRTLIMRLIRKGNVRINRKRAKPDDRLQSGDEVFLPASLRQPAEPMPLTADIPASLLKQVASLHVLFEDSHLLAVYKPAGMVVHGGSGYNAGLIEALKVGRDLPDLRLAHRLDRDTSGVLLMAKTLPSLRALTESFRERDMQKTYFALVAGHPFAHAGRMQSKLSKGVVQGGERMVIDADEGKESVTDFQVSMQLTCEGFPYSLMALNPHSGRTHQLRVQLAGEGHAILGDGKYGEKADNQAFKRIGGKGLALHAWRLRFVHPASGNPMELRAPLPQGWFRLLAN
ncbi:MAG TPA: RluA family pseudouridine synthase [Mariprofundaceae bacterium]|nr:RluA family pseudouridine synthase [Mariprofundaceae bacterium]